MSVDCAHVEGDWELFALGSLDPDAQDAMASHLRSGCQECLRRLLEAQAAVASIAASAPSRQPSARVERELMKRIRAEQKPEAAWRWPHWNWAPWAVAAACALAAGLIFWQQRQTSSELTAAQATIQSLRQEILSIPSHVPPLPESRPESAKTTATPAPGLADKQKLQELESQIATLREEAATSSAALAAAEQRTAELQAELNASQTRADALTRDLEAEKQSPRNVGQPEIADLNRRLSESRAEVQRLSQARARSAQIEGLLQSGLLQQVELRAVDRAAGKAIAHVLYSPKGGLLLIADALPKLDREKCYQLWLIRKGAPAIVSGGLLQASDDGRGFLFAPPGSELAQLTGLAITDEPKGGSVSARGHKLLFGAR